MKQEEDGALRRRKEDKERPLLQNSGQIEKKIGKTERKAQR